MGANPENFGAYGGKIQVGGARGESWETPGAIQLRVCKTKPLLNGKRMKRANWDAA